MMGRLRRVEDGRVSQMSHKSQMCHKHRASNTVNETVPDGVVNQGV